MEKDGSELQLTFHSFIALPFFFFFSLVFEHFYTVCAPKLSITAVFRWYPPGHGNIFQAMSFSGILDELIAEGRDICFISNIDNTGATTDLRIAKYMVDSGIEYALECTNKTPADTKVCLRIDTG